MSKKWGIAIIVLLIAILVRQSMIINEMQQLQSSVSNSYRWLDTNNDQIRQMALDIREMNKENDLIQSMEYQYDPIESQESTTFVSMTYTLNKNKTEDSVSLHYRPVDGETWESITLERTQSNEYVGTINSDYTCDFETKLVVDSDGTLYTEPSQTLKLYTDSIPRYNWELRPRQVTSDGSLTYEASLDIADKWNPIKIVRASVTLTYKGDVLDEFELMEEEFKQFEEEDFTAWSADRQIRFEPEDEEVGFSDFEWVLTVEDVIGRTYEHRDNR